MNFPSKIIFADNVREITYENFVDNISSQFNGISKSYNASTGVLTLVFEQNYNSAEAKYGYDFTFPIIILDRFNVGG